MRKLLAVGLTILGVRLVVTCLGAIPIWLIWTAWGLGSRYFSFLPSAWQAVPLLHIIGLLLLAVVLKIVATGAGIEVKV